MGQATPNLRSRREVLRQILGATLVPFLPTPAIYTLQAQNPIATTSNEPALSAEDDQFLNDVEAASFRFFWEQGNPRTGMVKDRTNVHADRPGDAASIAATGFGLTALCIGAQRGFVST